MPSIDTLLSFSLAALILSLSPGPSNLYIMTRSISQGQLAGIAAAGGMAIGSIVYVLATAFGIAAIFSYFPVAFTILKLAGAAYLIYLGGLYIYSSCHAHTHPDKPHIRFMSKTNIFQQSIIVELTNPKSALFFVAFLPQFVTSQSGSVISQLIILGTLYALIALTCDLCVALLSGKLGNWLAQHPTVELWQGRISGLVLLALGSYIAFTELLSDWHQR